MTTVPTLQPTLHELIRRTSGADLLRLHELLLAAERAGVYSISDVLAFNAIEAFRRLAEIDE